MELWITGAAGRIGTILRKHWLGKHTIVGIDHRDYEPLPGEERHIADIASTEFWTLLAAKASGDRVPETAKQGQYETKLPIVLVHLAAATSNAADWTALERTNIRGTHNVFRLGKHFDVQQVIFASSNHVTGGYGDWTPGEREATYTPPSILITPDMPPHPDSLYAVSKSYGEALGKYCNTYLDLPVICLRIGSVTDRDDPTENPRLRSTWLSHSDCCRLFDCCLTANVRSGIYYGVSNNTRRFWDISNAERELGYRPQDNAELWYTKGEHHANKSD